MVDSLLFQIMDHLQTTEFDFQPGKHTAKWRPSEPMSLKKPGGVVRIGHLSDFHFGKPTKDGVPAEEAAERWLDAFSAAGVDLLAMTGDVVEEPGDAKRLEHAKKLLDEARFEYVVIPGNHDVPTPGTPGPFEKIFGNYPRLERHGDIELVVLDSMQGLPPSERSFYDRMEAESGKAYSRGRVGPTQLRDIEERLTEPPLYGRILLVHHHLRTNAPTKQGRKDHPTEPWGLMGPLDDAHELVEWASHHQVHLILHGHQHNFWDPYEPRPGLIVLNSGTSTLGKPKRPRRARIIDVFPNVESMAVHDLELSF